MRLTSFFTCLKLWNYTRKSQEIQKNTNFSSGSATYKTYSNLLFNCNMHLLGTFFCYKLRWHTATPLKTFHCTCATRKMTQLAYNLSAVPLIFLLFLGHLAKSQLDYRFYDSTCPNLTRIVRYSIWPVISNDTRMAASLLRLHFHDCIVNVIRFTDSLLFNKLYR